MGLMGKLFKRKKVEVSEQGEVISKPLYVLMEVQKEGVLNYMLTTGVSVAKMTDSIEDMNKALIMEDESYRLLVIDFSAGLFNGISKSAQLIELIESVSLGKNDVSVLTNNGTLIKDLKDKKIPADIDNYKGVSSINRMLSRYREKYTKMGEFNESDTGHVENNHLSFTGVKVERENIPIRRPKDIDMQDIEKDCTEEIEAFELKI